MTRTIYLPALERSVTLRAYNAAVRHAIDHPELEYKHGLTSWWSTTGAEIRSQFREGIHDRINQRTPYQLRGTPHELYT
uniref:Uncharacterized protein n=1 Tax=viral metagenome TaxID=1070528 RepID=A0A6M3L5A5_9ZZZZ